MIRNYIKIAFRNFAQNKSDTLITIIGLSVGVAATILIILSIQFELSYDKFHQDSDSLYRISVIHKKEGKVEYDSPLYTPPIGPAMKADFPEVDNFVRVRSARIAFFSYNNRAYKINKLRHTDSTFFDIFSFPLLAGDPKQALTAPFSIVLTEETARKIFANEDPLGKVVVFENKQNYQITGIVANPPSNSHLQFNALVSFSSLYLDPTMYLGWNGGNQYLTYIRLEKNAGSASVQQKFPEFMWEKINKKYASYGSEQIPYLQPLSELHLFWNPYSKSLRTNIYIFSFIALLILIIACINFINLTTARSTKRAKEVGIRKVLGASRDHLKTQFLVESLILSFLSMVCALLLVEIFFPVYKNLIGKNISTLQLDSLIHLGGISSLIIIVGLLAGSYPSFYLASLSPIKSIKGILGTGQLKVKLRNALVVIQFSISIILIISTIFINRQLNYMENLTLGFKKENMVILPLTTDELQVKSRLLKNDIWSLPNVISVTASSEVPSNGFTSNGYIPEGQSFPMMIHVVDVDEQFLDSYQISVIEGRNFSSDRPTDKSSYMINETLANFLNWKEILDKTIKRNGVHPVIGVVKDFNFSTLHDRIGPLIITNQPDRDRFNFLSVNIEREEISSTLAAMEDTWQKYAAGIPFEFHFLDEALDNLYKSEQRLQEIILYFSLLAFIIASLGLYSLSSIITQQKIKEIGIRKVLGATTPMVTKLITENYLKLVIMANVFAWPIAWYIMHLWLENFSYRIEFTWWVFLVAGIIVVLISLITVSFQAIKAALSNPIDALRYE